MNKVIIKRLAKIANKIALRASGDISYYGFHQPKEPAALKKNIKHGFSKKWRWFHIKSRKIRLWGCFHRSVYKLIIVTMNVDFMSFK